MIIKHSSEKSFASSEKVDRKWIDVSIPCKIACPIMTDIPGYIEALKNKDYKKAYLINRRDNVLPSILGRICHRPCEKACRHGWDGLGETVSICHLKRSASDFGMKPLDINITPNNKTVCIVGAGPCGLTVANDLALKGYKVTVIEQFDHPGGMLRYGIPQFRLPHEVVERDVRSITELGVTIECNRRIEDSKSVEELQRMYDAVVIAGGCAIPKTLDMPGIGKYDGFFWGLDFMYETNCERLPTGIETAIVVGGGFTAVDCARMAYRIGAKKIIITFRRTKDDMVIGDHEFDAFEKEGVEIAYLVTPIGVEIENNKVSGIRLIRNHIEKDLSLKTITGSEFTIEADCVIFAIGQKSEELPGVEQYKSGDNLFVAGDFRNGASTVIESAADGRKVARDVHKHLSDVNNYKDIVHIEPVSETGRKRDYDFIPQQAINEVPVNKRCEKNREVETGFTKDDCFTEAKRCYLCHFNFQIDIDRCIYCLACIEVMPVDCIKMAKEIVVEDDGNLKYVAAKGWDEVRAITIDNDKCIRCGNCYRACPVDCISISKYSLETVEVSK